LKAENQLKFQQHNTPAQLHSVCAQPSSCFVDSRLHHSTKPVIS